MDRSVVDEVCDHLERGPAHLGGRRLLTVDGPSGSGKSTLAREVARRYDAPVVALDDLLYGWEGPVPDAVRRVVEGVLQPWSRGLAGRYRRYDWHRGRFADVVDVPLRDVLVVEGVGAGSRAVEPFCTTSVWLDGPPEERRRRALARDGEAYAPYWDHWAGVEADLFAAEQTRDRADLRWWLAEPAGR